MSKGETGADASGWKRGLKGFGKSRDDSDFTTPSYKKELFEQDAVGQRASVGDGEKLKQKGY